MQKVTAIQQIIAEVVVGLGYEFVGCRFSTQRSSTLLKVYIDQPDGVKVADCGRVNRQLNSVLAVAATSFNYALEVSSPGIDRPLFTRQHYAQFIGCEVNVRLTMPRLGRRNFTGKIASVTKEHVALELPEGEVQLVFSEIEKGQLKGELRPTKK